MAKINDNKEILSLLEKPLWQMTGKEFCMLNQYVISITTGLGSANQSPVHVTGVHALAEYLQ